MRTMRDNNRGITLMEVILVAAIIGAILWGFIRFFTKNAAFFQHTKVRQQTVLSSRMCMDTIMERLRNGKARSLIISTPAGSTIVPNSRVDFDLQTPLPSGATSYAIFLNNGTVYTEEYPPGDASIRSLAANVSGLMFTGNSQDPGLVYVTLQMDTVLDQSQNDGSNNSTMLLPNQVVHMVESQ